MRADSVLDIQVSSSCRIERAPGLTHLCRFAHRFSQLLSGLRQQARWHIAFGHVGVHHKHRHDDFSSAPSSPPSLTELQLTDAATQPQRRRKLSSFPFISFYGSWHPVIFALPPPSAPECGPDKQSDSAGFPDHCASFCINSH